MLHTFFGEYVRVHGAAAGMHVVAEFEGVAFTEERIRRLLQSGVYIVSVESHSLTKGNHINQIILGYAGLTRDAMVRGLDLLKAELSLNNNVYVTCPQKLAGGDIGIVD